MPSGVGRAGCGLIAACKQVGCSWRPRWPSPPFASRGSYAGVPCISINGGSFVVDVTGKRSFSEAVKPCDDDADALDQHGDPLIVR
jgi:hypothetical protein